jgi:hypothetical protein
LGRLFLAIRSFFGILFRGRLPDDVARKLGLRVGVPRSATAPPTVTEGALQMLAIFQRDARLVDFLMEDISGYSDDQVGAAVRGLHEQCRQSLARYVRLAPVIDGVEGSFTKLEGVPDPSRVKLLGNVPADGRPPGGLLRHKGWRAEHIELPAPGGARDATVVAPAEIEVE